MQLESVDIRNYRRLQNCKISLEEDNTIFVGANNSGKTSAGHILQTFLGSQRPDISIYDFSASCWNDLDEFGSATSLPKRDPPAIELDLWFAVDENNLHRVLHLLPSLNWRDAPVGVRLSFTVRDKAALFSAYQAAKEAALKTVENEPDANYHPWPKTMTQYLEKRLNDHYRLEYYILDYAAVGDQADPDSYRVRTLGDTPELGRSTVQSIIRVDFLHAQRHLSDDSKGRSEDLSKRLSRFYKRNLQQLEHDPEVLRSLAESELQLNEHLATVFKSTIDRLGTLGYPGFAEPHLLIKSAFSPEGILSHDASVHYLLNETGAHASGTGSTLPDKYNGLGFKNLIYMVIEILDFHQAWSSHDLNRPPIHLVVIEEPEAHLHAQLQQVFIREIRNVLPVSEENFRTQMIVTTHSSHIVHESRFSPIRYFRRSGPEGQHHQSEVLNLSRVMATDDTSRLFLQRYMKLTHCDLLFADAAILVEGNVERLLLPLMIDAVADGLRSNYLTILEVGGAFAQRFKELVEFLGLPTLIVTDLDSIESTGSHKACRASMPDTVTSNETLRSWIPRLESVSDLLHATEAAKTVSSGRARVRVTYQGLVRTAWGSEVANLAGRTFEEAFALENLAWTQAPEQKELHLAVVAAEEEVSLDQMAQRIFDRVRSSGFKKTEFALALMMADRGSWRVPTYIADGLLWLKKELIRKSEVPLNEVVGPVKPRRTKLRSRAGDDSGQLQLVLTDPIVTLGVPE